MEHIKHKTSFYQAGLCHKCGLAKYRRILKCLRSGTVRCRGTRLGNLAEQKVAFTVCYMVPPDEAAGGKKGKKAGAQLQCFY